MKYFDKNNVNVSIIYVHLDILYMIKKKLHSMYVHAVDILAQLSDVAHLPFVLFPVISFISLVPNCFI